MEYKELITEIYDELNENNMGIYEQPVQHFNVVTLVWLMFVPNEIEFKLWSEVFKKELKKKGHQSESYRLLTMKAFRRKKRQ